jgi:hypothetical protein
MSCSSAATSTPVGPPPHTTKDSSLAFSSGGVWGRAARSKHSETWRRRRAASSMDLKKKACSATPWRPNVLLTHPTASTRTSYGTLKHAWSRPASAGKQQTTDLDAGSISWTTASK